VPVYKRYNFSRQGAKIAKLYDIGIKAYYDFLHGVFAPWRELFFLDGH